LLYGIDPMDAASDLQRFAIVGIGCRLPPAASSLQSFWRFLMRGGNALRPIKGDRWDWRQFFDEDPNRPGKSYAPKAASLDADVQQFDPLAFGISPREAASLDPQQRLLLEVTWEAFEDAGVPLERVSGSLTGVFIGGFCLDHLIGTMQPSNRHLSNAHTPAGVMMTVLSNRLSHAFNLRGPSLTLDTACSSSLVAIHYACQSLRLHECDMVLAGGVNVMSRPEFPIMMSKGHFLSHHGECHAFDESAAGYARGEGAGVLLIKRYEDAVAAGDNIHAVIRGTGVNQDGHTDGISLPNSEAQESLVRDVYRKAGVRPADVDYIEAHGTGTQAGDPAEARALHASFAEGRDPRNKLIVGSVKTNIGHTEAVAGVAGTIKAIGVLKFRQVPKNLHFKNPNPKIPFDQYCLEVAKETRTLRGAEEKPTLYAGVNSFGYGGTNAHVVLESAPVAAPRPATQTTDEPFVIPFSARSAEALRDLLGKFAFQLGQSAAGSLGDLAYTAAFRRSHLEVRGAAVTRDLGELREQLMAASAGQPHDGIVVSTKSIDRGAGLAFVYTGMGPQWWAMGRELIQSEPIVRSTIEEIDEYFVALAGWSLKEAMLADETSSRMERTELAQPANFALQVALTRLWESYGIRPSAVIGHSVGEVTSAYVAGVYTLEEAVRVSYHRSRLQQTTAGQGAMLAVGLPEAEAEREIAAFPGVSIGAINSFQAVTLSGDSEQLAQIAAALEARGIFQKFLRVEVAYHSPQMDPIHDELVAALSDLAPQPPRMPLYSTAYGEIVPANKWGADYWWHNVRQPVHFASAIRKMFEDGYVAFLEIGPHPVLGNSIKECAAHLQQGVTCFTSMRRKEPEKPRIFQTLAELYCAGFDPDWTKLSPISGQFVPGPQYPWQRQRHWLESERSKMERLGLPGAAYLNRSVLAPRPCWEVEINRNYFPFLFDHGVQDQTVFAGMAYIEAAISAARQLYGDPGVISLENVNFEHVLVIDYSKLQYLLTEFDPSEGRFAISSRVEGEEDSIIRQCRGRARPQSDASASHIDIDAFLSDCPRRIEIEAFYDDLRHRGLHYGPAFRPTTEVHVGEDCFVIKMNAGPVLDDSAHPLHPTLFDAAIQPVLYCAMSGRLYVPFSIEQFQYFGPPSSEKCVACGRLLSQSNTTIIADVWLADPSGKVYGRARRMVFRAIETNASSEEANRYYEYTWKPAAIGAGTPSNGADFLILADTQDSDLDLARELVSMLPDAALVIRESSPAGFGTQEMKTLLSGEHSSRKRILVLWGSSKSPDATAEGVVSLEEKVAGLLQAIQALSKEYDVSLVTRGAQSVGDERSANFPALSLSALGLLAENEIDPLRCRSIDLASDETRRSAEWIIAEAAAESRGDIAYRDGERYERTLKSYRQEKDTGKVALKSLEYPVELRIAKKGQLDSLRFVPAERAAPADGEVEIRVHCASLNNEDVQKVEGRVHPLGSESGFWGAEIGMECAGIVTRVGDASRFRPGDRVVALAPRTFRSFVTAPENLVVPIPPDLAMDAAAIPVVFLTAWRGLVEIANLQPGERVLVHQASGGLGLAAIQIARWIGAEILATAGSEEKIRSLHEMGITHVFPSRTLDFGERVRKATHGEGVDVVIGAQSGQALHVSLSALRTGGRCITVGKRDIAEDNDLPLRAFGQNLTFAAVDLDQLVKERPDKIQRMLKAIFERFEHGDFKQQAVRSFAPADVLAAFRELAENRHLGKYVVDLSSGEVEVHENPPPEALVKRDGCYIVTGGTSGFGLETARWLAANGAGKIVLVSRSGRNAPGIGDAVTAIEAQGTEVDVCSVDVSDATQVRALLEKASAGSFALRGIVHGAMVLDDVMLADLTEESFRRVFMPKAIGAFHLACEVPKYRSLDFCVFYSSVSSLIGNRGQASYVAANAFMDGLAHDLRAQDVPALSINWGALAEVGVVARDERIGAMLSSAGITGLTNREALDALEVALRSAKPQLGIFAVDWASWNEAHPKLTGDPRFREQQSRAQKRGENPVAAQIRAELAEASREQRLRTLECRLQDVLAGVLKMPADAVSVSRKINELGVDSLMVLELSLGIEERIGARFSAMEFLKGPTIQQLATLAENKLWQG
jgi:acyl transferase domain-containing protein/acyl carrier protein